MSAGAPTPPGADGLRAAMQGPRNVGFSPRAKNPSGTLARLARYFDEARGTLALVVACVVLYTTLALSGPWLMGTALDRFVATRDATGLGRIAAMMLVAFAASNALQVVANWLMAGVSQRALARLRADLFVHVQRLPLSFFDATASGELMSRLTNDIDAVNQAVAQNIISLLASVLSMVGIVVAMFALDRWLALASLFVVPLMLGFTRWVAAFTRRGFRDLQRDLGELNGVMEESIGGQKVVTVFGRNESVMARFEGSNERVYATSVKANTYALLLMPLTSVLGNLFVITLAGLGGWLALSGLVSVGVIAAFINYAQNFVQPLRQLSNLYNTLQGALAGAERVFELLDTPGEIDDAKGAPPAEVRGHVVFDHVTFGYRPGRPVLRDVSLEALPGQTIALVGPTGAGKTTVINLLTRFYELDSGAIRLDGLDLREWPKSSLRRELGLVLQDTFLFGASVRDNIRYGRLDATDEEVERAAVMAEADHFIRQLPKGYDTMLSERAGNLSQGQRQLLSIARALLADPAVLILDEATSSVDTRTEARIQSALLRLRGGRTSFVIAHRLSTIRDADQVLVIDGGVVAERGTHGELIDKGGIYAKLYRSQFKGASV